MLISSLFHFVFQLLSGNRFTGVFTVPPAPCPWTSVFNVFLFRVTPQRIPVRSAVRREAMAPAVPNGGLDVCEAPGGQLLPFSPVML